ncbi:histidinol-phosphate transaminase [Wohlfahrtiimonas chitiniclastica]|uniref:histidinol-phosphate transaminase n=1 Tax=Wohlfahrtiimonas chitiniclastica TaxID=400946 RepID=UPI000B99827A|nr:histidinol-phosphate transaminase [Wohlfahrtiimonas chitiniclastica]OYQ84923.1 histidinol-phosphate transaminase [Wohlfahrtiimonas chitiniclastica]OYQ86843.1 histidinol-phosphate transaminase [Wohlfahrtiimonas chitiniclastica]
MNIEKRSLNTLEPYSVAPRDEDLSAIYLDANENPYPQTFILTNATFNRYPESQPTVLIERYAKFLGVQPENILVSLGGDEAIKLIIEAYCNGDEDAILCSPPTFGMYAIDAQVVGAKVLTAPLTQDFQLDVPALLESMQDAKVVFICSPNNPTGNVMKLDEMETILRAADHAIVVVDEAYIEFADQPSFASRLAEFPNLAIIRTLSKAFGLAGIRCGFTVANHEVIRTLKKVIAPYPMPSPVVAIAESALTDAAIDQMKANVARIQATKSHFIEALATLDCVTKVYRSDANFVLIEVTAADALMAHLKNEHIYVKRQSGTFSDLIRISIGTDEEMARVITALKNFV